MFQGAHRTVLGALSSPVRIRGFPPKDVQAQFAAKLVKKDSPRQESSAEGFGVSGVGA